MSYKTDLQSNNTELQANNTDLQAILDMVNALPEGGSHSGGVTAITVKGDGSVIQVYDVVQKAFVSVSTSGTTVNVTDHLLIKNVVKLMATGYGSYHLNDGGTPAFTTIAGILTKGYVWAVEFTVDGVSAGDISYITIEAAAD